MTLPTNALASDHTCNRTLLIVDADSSMRRAYSRYFQRHFAETLTCASPDLVEQLVVRRAVTDLICGQFFDDSRLISEVVKNWRVIRPSLENVILITGALQAQPSDQFDAVFEKPFDPRDVLACFFAGQLARACSASCPSGGAIERKWKNRWKPNSKFAT